VEVGEGGPARALDLYHTRLVYHTLVWYSLLMPSSRADTLADQLSLDILRGSRPPGSRLPSVRELARTHQVSASTIQRVLMVLEARGLVRARDRSGILVLDPERHTSLSTWPLLVAYAHQAPDLAMRLLRDVLSTRRTLALDVVQGIVTHDLAGARATLEPLVLAFIDAAEAPTRDPRSLCDAEHDLLRSVLIVARRPAVLGILNGIEQVLRASPVLVEALYAEPDLAVGAWTGVLSLMKSGPVDAEQASAMLPFLEAALEAADVRALDVVAATLLSEESP